MYMIAKKEYAIHMIAGENVYDMNEIAAKKKGECIGCAK